VHTYYGNNPGLTGQALPDLEVIDATVENKSGPASDSLQVFMSAIDSRKFLPITTLGPDYTSDVNIHDLESLNPTNLAAAARKGSLEASCELVELNSKKFGLFDANQGAPRVTTTPIDMVTATPEEVTVHNNKPTDSPIEAVSIEHRGDALRKKSGFVFNPKPEDAIFFDTIRAAPHPSTHATIDPIDMATATPEEIRAHERAKIDLLVEKTYSFDITESLKEVPVTPVNTTNIVVNNGKEVNLAKLSNRELYDLVYETQTEEELDAIQNTETIRSMYHHSIPTTKLQYPEPFLASPSLIHNDLGFLHILQYQF